ncbi:beta-lactamase family protein [Tieghemostelium lacteum]|uniref:Beta-lactamase family protein n=1 Tax=Tieghemostelium lacteum TaxID=361077 RepID=A0A151ZH78_TIELA|nr:beta-lactamase family protein [Tieghemostelium lacteum]|eukprot:KYQ93332.1 beta-lactamase family protein [Tieghemostelium lacteum]
MFQSNDINDAIQLNLKKVEDYIQFLIEKHTIPTLSVTLYDKSQDKVILEKVFHHKDCKTPIPSVTKTLFRVASVSKLFTCIALLQLVEQGKIKLEDPLTKYIPNFHPILSRRDESEVSGEDPNSPCSITVFQLMRHTSGLIREPVEGSYFNMVQCNLEELVKSMNRSIVDYAPGSVFKYSNAAVAIAGYVVQVASGMLFEDYIYKFILEPLDMKSSSFHRRNFESKVLPDDSNIRTAVAHMWRYWDETNQDISVFTEAPNTDFGMNPAGGLRTSLRDISKFIKMFLNLGNPLISTESFMNFITPHPLQSPSKEIRKNLQFETSEYTRGLGVEIGELFGYLQTRHGGAINGFASDFRVLPELGLGSLVVSTLDCCNSISIEVSKYLYSCLVPLYCKPTHLALKYLSRDKIMEQCNNTQGFVAATMKNLKPISKEVIEGLVGYHLLSPEDTYIDNSSLYVYQEYNGKYFMKSTHISEIQEVEHNGKRMVIIFDRMSCNEVLVHDVNQKPLKIGELNRMVSESENNLKYLPYQPLLTSSQVKLLKLPPMSPNNLDVKLLGIYEAKDQIVVIYEEDGLLYMCIEWLFIYKLEFKKQTTTSVEYHLSSQSMYNYEYLTFYFKNMINLSDASQVPDRLELSGIPFFYKGCGSKAGKKQDGVYERDVVQKALTQSKSIEFPFKVEPNHNLVDLTTLSKTFQLDIKYATEENFSGIQLYKEAKAFLHKDAAKQLVKAHEWLSENFGLGIVIFDAYRPWSITWTMAESVCEEFRGKYVADPKKGSVHNRGGAVDISLYHIKTGEQVTMSSDYDELSIRSHRSYFGGTSQQRWYRKLLTMVMMNYSFAPYPQEWWHFDYQSSTPLPVLNIPFNEIN